MGWMRLTATVLAVASMGMAASAAMAAGPQCKAQCDTAYQGCLSSGKDQDACLKSWGMCKRNCLPKPASTTATPPASPKPH